MKAFGSAVYLIAVVLWASRLSSAAVTLDEYLNKDYRAKLGFSLPTSVEGKVLEIVKGDHIIEVSSLAYASRSTHDVIAATYSLRIPYELGRRVMHITCVVIRQSGEMGWDKAIAFQVNKEPAQIIEMSMQQIMDARSN